MLKITSPEKHYNGVTSGVTFTNGVAIAELDNFSKEWFIEKGYIVEETDTPKVETPVVNPVNENPEAGEQGSNQDESNNNDSLKGNDDTSKPKTKAELLEEAKELGIEGIRNKATNKEIEDLIADKKAELEALGDNGASNDGNPEAGNNENENPETGATGDEDPEKGE